MLLFSQAIFVLFFISPLFSNQVVQLRTSSHLQLRPGQDKAKQCDLNNTELYKQTYSQKHNRKICTARANVEE